MNFREFISSTNRKKNSGFCNLVLSEKSTKYDGTHMKKKFNQILNNVCGINKFPRKKMIIFVQ